MKLLYGTSSRLVPQILANGITEKYPYLTDDKDVADYYADGEVDEHGGDPVVLTVEPSTQRLRASRMSFDEPLTFYRDEWAYDDDEWHEKIESDEIPSPKNDKDWKTSLEVVRTVLHEGPVPPGQISAPEMKSGARIRREVNDFLAATKPRRQKALKHARSARR